MAYNNLYDYLNPFNRRLPGEEDTIKENDPVAEAVLKEKPGLAQDGISSYKVEDKTAETMQANTERGQRGFYDQIDEEKTDVKLPGEAENPNPEDVTITLKDPKLRGAYENAPGQTYEAVDEGMMEAALKTDPELKPWKDVFEQTILPAQKDFEIYEYMANGIGMRFADELWDDPEYTVDQKFVLSQMALVMDGQMPRGFKYTYGTGDAHLEAVYADMDKYLSEDFAKKLVDAQYPDHPRAEEFRDLTLQYWKDMLSSMVLSPQDNTELDSSIIRQRVADALSVASDALAFETADGVDNSRSLALRDYFLKDLLPIWRQNRLTMPMDETDRKNLEALEPIEQAQTRTRANLTGAPVAPPREDEQPSFFESTFGMPWAGKTLSNLTYNEEYDYWNWHMDAQRRMGTDISFGIAPEYSRDLQYAVGEAWRVVGGGTQTAIKNTLATSSALSRSLLPDSWIEKLSQVEGDVKEELGLDRDMLAGDFFGEDIPEPRTAANRLQKGFVQAGVGMAIPMRMGQAAYTAYQLGKTPWNVVNIAAKGAPSYVPLATISKMGVTPERLNNIIAGVVSDATVWGVNEGRMFDLIHNELGIDTVIGRALLTKPDDTALESHMKDVLEGIYTGVFFDLLMSSRKLPTDMDELQAEHAAKRFNLYDQDVNTSILDEINTQRKRMAVLSGDPNAPKFDEFEEAILRSSDVPEGMDAGAPVSLYDRFINMDYEDVIYASGDIKANTQDIADWIAAIEQTQGRGTISNARAQAIARVGYDKDWVLKLKRGDAVNQSQWYAINDAYKASAYHTAQTLKAWELDGSVEIKTALQENLQKFLYIRAIRKGVRTEWGRTGQAIRRTLESTKGADVLAKQLEEQIDVLGQLDMFDMDVVADALMKSAGDSGTVLDALSNSLDQVKGPNAGDMFKEYFYNSLLSGVSTQAVNVMSNATMVGMRPIDKIFAATFSSMENIVRGGNIPRAERVYYAEALAELYGSVAGIWEATKRASRVYWTEQPFDPITKMEQGGKLRSIPSFKIPLGKDAKLGHLRLGGRQVRIPGRALMAMDEFFKTVQRRQYLAMDATYKLRSHGYNLHQKEFYTKLNKMINGPTQQVMKDADHFARQGTFTTPPGPFISAVRNLTETVPGGFLGLPFVNTPANIVKESVGRSVANIPGKVWKRFYGKALKERGFHDIMGRVATGASLMAIGYYGFDDLGEIGFPDLSVTGPGPSDPGQRNTYREKYGLYSFYDSEAGESTQYNRLDPIGSLIAYGRVVRSIMEAGEISDEGGRSLFEVAAFGLNEIFINKTWTQQPSRILQALFDPQETAWTRVGAQTLGTMVPTIAAHWTGTEDYKVYEVFDILDVFNKRLGNPSSLPRVSTITGQPLSFDVPMNLVPGTDSETAARMIGVIYRKEDPMSQTIDEMIRVGFGRDRQDRTLKGVKLTELQYFFLSKLAAKWGFTEATKLINTQEYQDNPSAKERRDALNQVYQEARDRAVEHMYTYWPELKVDVKMTEFKEPYSKVYDADRSPPTHEELDEWVGPDDYLYAPEIEDKARLVRDSQWYERKFKPWVELLYKQGKADRPFWLNTGTEQDVLTQP